MLVLHRPKHSGHVLTVRLSRVTWCDSLLKNLNPAGKALGWGGGAVGGTTLLKYCRRDQFRTPLTILTLAAELCT